MLEIVPAAAMTIMQPATILAGVARVRRAPRASTPGAMSTSPDASSTRIVCSVADATLCSWMCG
jgi:hypothetical protein